jgi:acylphosphatase
MATIKHLNIIVSGKVQGVSYRVSTKAVADQLSIRGLIANQSDGSVYIEAEADEWNMQLFLDWCHEGPQGSVVTSVESHEADLKNYRNFEVVKKSPQ